MKKIFNNWFFIIFFLVMIIPVYAWPLDSKVALSGVTAATEKIECNIASLGDGTYQTYLNEIWEKKFPGRNIVLRIRNQILYSICKVSPNTNVVIGKDSYLYEPLYILNENQTYAPSSIEYFETLGNNLKQLDELLQQNGKELYVFVTPSKAHFCKEFIPDKYMFLNQEKNYEYSNYSKLIEIFEKNNIKYYDSIEYIDNNIGKGTLKAPLFYQTGIHWSQPWGETCAARLLDYINENSKYELASVGVKESICSEPVQPATDLYSSLNLLFNAKGEWWDSEMEIKKEGKDKPSVFLRGGSFMGQSLSALIRTGVFDKDVHFENNYYFVNNYTETHMLNSFTDYNEVDLNQLVGQSDILILEVNENAIDKMSFGFIEYLLEHQDYLDC